MYKEILEKEGSYRKAAKSLGITKSKFMVLYKKELGLCTATTGCMNKCEDGKTRCKEHLKYAVKTRNSDLQKEYMKTWAKEHEEELREYGKNYRKNNLDKFRDYNKKQRQKDDYNQKNADRRAKRRAIKKQALPKWVDKDQLKLIYKACPQNYHVDHIIPLSNNIIQGLHVPWNLQYLSHIENESKCNKFDGTYANESWRKDCWILKRVYNPSELLREFENIVKDNRLYEATCNKNKITTHFNPHFYEKEQELFSNYYIRERLIKNRCKYLNKTSEELSDIELLRGFKISGIHYGFSHHASAWIKAFINEFSIKSIYDPCGGWGHRLLGSNDIRYIYNDIDPRSVKGAKDISNFFNMKNKFFYNKDACEFTPPEDYEAVFTCPPYFNTESYTNLNTSTNRFPLYSGWLKNFWKELAVRSIKPTTKYFAFIINEKYQADMMNIITDLGHIPIKCIPVGNTGTHHFHKNKKSNNQEYLVVFRCYPPKT